MHNNPGRPLQDPQGTPHPRKLQVPPPGRRPLGGGAQVQSGSLSKRGGEGRQGRSLHPVLRGQEDLPGGDPGQGGALPLPGGDLAGVQTGARGPDEIAASGVAGRRD